MQQKQQNIVDQAGSFVRIDHLTKRFDEVAAVDDVSIDIAKGEIFALLGSSGCGKSTLLRMLAGFETPTLGNVYLDGAAISKMPPYERPINMMFQSYALFPHLTVWENIAFGLKRDQMPKDKIAERVEAMLNIVQLKPYAKRKPHQLSGGQQQRVALARCLAKSPKLLLLDEPLGALDLKLREHMKIELKQLQAAFGTTFVYITHDQSEALVLSDHVAVMNAGRFEQLGTPQELYYAPQTPFVAGFVGANNGVKGRATEVNADIVSVTSANGLTLPARAMGSVRAGDAVEVFVRPEVASLSRSASVFADAGLPHYQARIESLLFDGANSAVLLQEENSHTEFRIALPQTGQLADLSVGERVSFGFDPRRAVCFAAAARSHAA